MEESGNESNRTANTGLSVPHTKDRKWTNRHTTRVSPVLIEVVPEETAVAGRKKQRRLKPETLDRIASVVFVILFLAFNVFYWTYFVTSNAA